MRTHRPHNTHARESSLRKLTRINRWLIAGSVALTGLFVEAAAHAFPGKSSARTAAAAKHAHAHAHAHHHDHTSHSSTHTQALNPPAQSPQATTESSAPAEPTAPQEPAPSEEAPHEAAPAQESAPVEPAPEPQATHESAPAPAEEAPPVVSGGS
jgi:hypothetical protein